MATLLPVCVPCANGDHSSHDDHEGFGGWDMLDCKVTSDDGRDQCMCRATSPDPSYGYEPPTAPRVVLHTDKKQDAPFDDYDQCGECGWVEISGPLQGSMTKKALSHIEFHHKWKQSNSNDDEVEDYENL